MAAKYRKNFRALLGRLPGRKIAFGVLAVYVGVASNYLSLSKNEATFVMKHPAAQVVIIFLLGFVAVREPGESWWLSFMTAAALTGLYLLFAHVL